MRTTEDHAVAVGHSVGPAAWQALFEQVAAGIAGRFRRVEPRRTARLFLLGLLSRVERKNCWQLAEHAGLSNPAPMQRLLREAVWDAEAVRDDVRDLVVEHLGHESGVLIVDETGFLKKGTDSIGVQRQYTGTAGRIENAQVAVFLAYASVKGRALVDRRIYLPASWTRDPDRCAAAGVPGNIGFSTKPRLALDMLADAMRAAVPAHWATGDEVYGNDPAFRAGVRDLDLGYVLAVARDHRITVRGGIRRRADQIAADLPTTAWQRYSAGTGSKGPRWYDWAWIEAGEEPEDSLLMRRNPDSGELAFYRTYNADPVALATLVRVAGTRWAVEESFQAAKGQVGLDHYQIRGWTPWHRHVTLTMLALALLAITAARHTPEAKPGPHRITHDDAPIPLTVPEIRRLFTGLLCPENPDPEHLLHWSAWRRHHQAQARRAHYRRRMTITASP